MATAGGVVVVEERGRSPAAQEDDDQPQPQPQPQPHPQPHPHQERLSAALYALREERRRLAAVVSLRGLAGGRADGPM